MCKAVCLIRKVVGDEAKEACECDREVIVVVPSLAQQLIDQGSVDLTKCGNTIAVAAANLAVAGLARFEGNLLKPTATLGEVMA